MSNIDRIDRIIGLFGKLIEINPNKSLGELLEEVFTFLELKKVRKEYSIFKKNPKYIPVSKIDPLNEERSNIHPMLIEDEALEFALNYMINNYT